MVRVAGKIRARPSGLIEFAIRRITLGLVTLFAISLVVFLATRALPTDPATAILGREATPERVASLRQDLGLTDPLATQYVKWLGDILTGDLGTSLAARVPVSQLIAERITNSLILLTITAIIAIPLAILCGALAAVRRDSALDKAALLGAFGLEALPQFVIGLVLVILFSTVVLHLAPAIVVLGSGESPLRHPDQLVLPVATLVLSIGPYLFRLVRGTMIDVLESDYVQMARLKGIPEPTVLRRHVLPNAAVPAVQASALALAWLLGGLVVIEFLFSYPGLGAALTAAITNRDLPVIQAIVVVIAAGVLAFNLVADMLSIYLTPRLRTSRS